MSLVELSGVAVVSGTITLHRAGRWSADLELEDASPARGARVELRGPSLALSGYVALVGTFQGDYRCRIYGGTGGLPKELPAKAFRSMPAKLLLEDVLGGVGERLSSSIEPDLLNRELTAWVRPAGPAAAALADLCGILGVSWRVQPEGTVWLGLDTWRASPATGELLDADPVGLTIHAALDAMNLLPGTTWQGAKVERVTHHISGAGFRTDVETQKPTPSRAAGQDSVRTAILAITRHHDFYAVRAAKVIAQNDDYSLELKPEDEAWPGMSRVPIRTGIPGVSVKVKAGARVLFTFEGGDAQRPIATLWDTATLKEIVVSAETQVVINCPDVRLGDESAQPIARLGDAVEMVFPLAAPIAGTVDGLAFVGTMTITDVLLGIITTAGTKGKAS